MDMLEIKDKDKTVRCRGLKSDSLEILESTSNYNYSTTISMNRQCNVMCSNGRTAQYKDHETLSGSVPRFQMYKDIDMKTCMPCFNPPLQYNHNLTDVDMKKVVGVPDSKTCTAKRMRRGGTQTVGARKLELPNINNGTTTGKALIAFLKTLVTSNSKSYSAIGLCNTAASRGPDFVSHHENTYCDMTNKKAYLLCSKIGNSILAEVCFDLESKILIPFKGIAARDIPAKEYHTVNNW